VRSQRRESDFWVLAGAFCCLLLMFILLVRRVGRSFIFSQASERARGVLSRAIAPPFLLFSSLPSLPLRAHSFSTPFFVFKSLPYLPPSFHSLSSSLPCCCCCRCRVYVCFQVKMIAISYLRPFSVSLLSAFSLFQNQTADPPSLPSCDSNICMWNLMAPYNY